MMMAAKGEGHLQLMTRISTQVKNTALTTIVSIALVPKDTTGKNLANLKYEVKLLLINRLLKRSLEFFLFLFRFLVEFVELDELYAVSM